MHDLGLDIHKSKPSQEIDTPLIDAVEYASLRATEILLAAGASVHDRNYDGRTAVQVSLEGCPNLDIISLLVHHGYDLSQLRSDGGTILEGIYYDRVEILSHLIALGANVNQRNNSGSTPLHYYANDDDVEVVRFLLEAGADPSLLDANGLTAADLTNNPTLRAILKNADPVEET